MKSLWIILLLISYNFGYTQKYIAQNSEITFFSDAPMEDIKAVNQDASSLFNSSTGELAYSVPIRGFQFKKSLMQQHFNEKYLESDKYPKSTFNGKVTGYSMNKSGKQNVTASGDLTIHGVTKDISVDGTMEISNENIQMNAVFMVKVAEYDIKIPKIVFYNIAEEVEVTIDFKYVPHEPQ